MFIVYPFYVMGSLLTTLLAFMLNPIVVLFADKDGYLPRWLYYFQTFDMRLPDNYWDAVKWLYRNPAYGFDLFLFGIKFNHPDWVIVVDDDKKFFAYDKNTGAFSFKHEGGGLIPAIKLGWKVFWMRDPAKRGELIDGYALGDEGTGKMPLCFTFMKY